MTITTSSNVGVFDESFYRTMKERVLGYAREDPDINWIPFAKADKVDAPQYKAPIYGASTGTYGAQKLGLPNLTMGTPKSHKVYDLEYVVSDIFYDAEDLVMEGNTLAQRKAEQLTEHVHQVKQSLFKGVFTGGFSAAGAGQGKRLIDGIVEQATIVNDLNGADSQLDAAGDIQLALTKMLKTIPFRYRQSHKLTVMCDDLFALNARKAVFRGSTNQESELDIWLREHSSSLYLLPGQSVDAGLKVSDALMLNLVAGTTKTEVDTLGTHSRLMMAAVSPDYLEQAYSYNGMYGEEQHATIKSVVQRWAARCAGCVHDANAVVYSEQITW
jgi:hypothetical protein